MRAVVYFLGPKTIWAKKIDPSEIIASCEVRALFAARLWAQTIHAPLDKNRCGWAIVNDDGEELEHIQALGVVPA